MDTIERISHRELHGRTKSERIANYLEELILTKQLIGGEYLRPQQELADKFDASSRSIREAFKQLEAKGLLSISQGKRACVMCNNLNQFVESLSGAIIRGSSSDTKLMLDLVQVRTTVEVAAAREFSRHPRRKEIVRELEEVTLRMERLLPLVQRQDQRAFSGFCELESTFHKIMVRSNNNLILDAIYENLSPLLDQTVSYTKGSTEEIEKLVRDYQYLVEALSNGQTDLAVALVLVNLTNLKKKIEMYVAQSDNQALA